MGETHCETSSNLNCTVGVLALAGHAGVKGNDR